MVCKKIFLWFLILPALLMTTNGYAGNPDSTLIWSITTGWKLDATPRAVAQSLDNRKVFILGTDATVYIYSVDGIKLGALPVDDGVVDIDIAPRGETLYLVNKKKNSYTAIDISFVRQIDISKASVIGNPKAPVTLVVFSDFECPFCKTIKPLIHQLLEKNPDTLKVAFKHLPLGMHPHARQAALAAIAAQNQGKFWEMHDTLFATKKMNKQAIDAAAEKIGLDMDQYKKDAISAETETRLEQDIQDARQAEITGTPALFINGVPVKQRSLEAVQAMIDEALKKQ